MESPNSSMLPFAKDKNSVKSVSLFSNKNLGRGLNYYSNLSERQGKGTIDDQILRKKQRVVQTETRTHSEEKEKKAKEQKSNKKFEELAESMNASQNFNVMETQIQKYEADIRKHISIEHQLQLYADDLKRNVQVLEKERDE